ncbi:MAG: hypothetical protein IPO92_13220 [Saprospiraceae bacterium]|nr:hypothetical protein [Saprospiraceae bacterium]
MKTFINLYPAILFVFFSLNLSGQIGVRAGINLSNLSRDPVDDDFNLGTKLGFELAFL